ncbi:hypothetical protein PIB30_091761 [Stylosanthes scabra]|uniref:Uncharacterized protein n=1 Tax=Stylosanthes scabra TaxID=79078 RepID=A0ABU6UX97_9FABA|nr:hypothetical protein [Stylosanthes scabra]
MEILQSTSSEATPPESQSKLHFEWVNLSDINLLGPEHYGLLETDGQLRALCGVSDKKEMSSLRKNEERKLAEQETKFGSKAEQELHAYAWKSMHMHATTSQIHT